jgi:anion-transporting  ArsA/GET3 family ATPase
MTPKSLEKGIREARVLVCAGTGGVGKTTIAAALAIQAALLGRRTLVLTIDPARRLANALGLDSLDSKPAPVDLEGASLEAMMLDAKPTFDRLIKKLTPNDSERRRILDNRIYQHLSSALAGSAEYAAMEQVHELVQSNQYDLVVVDTPPADHALDFLRAPQRLREFLESRFVHTLVRPAMSASRIGLRLFGRPLHKMLGLLERIAGVGFLDDLSEFLSAIDGLSQGFRDRASRVENILLSDETGFVLISSGDPGSSKSAREFLSELERFRVPLIAVVANRLRPWPIISSPADMLNRCSEAALAHDEARLADALGATGPTEAPPDAESVTRSFVEYALVCDAERRTVDLLAAQVAQKGLPCIRVHELSGDIGQFDGLLEIGAMLRTTSEREPKEGSA